MRVFHPIWPALLVAWISAPALAQSADPNADACLHKSGAEKITGCTALISSGEFSGAALALAYRLRGLGYIGEKDYVRALADLNESIRLDPSRASSFLGRGIAYIFEKDYVRALADLNESIRLDPSKAISFFNRAVAYIGEKDYVRALVDLNEAIGLNPQYALAFYDRGRVEAKLGQTDASRADMARALKLDPNIARVSGVSTNQTD